VREEAARAKQELEDKARRKQEQEAAALAEQQALEAALKERRVVLGKGDWSQVEQVRRPPPRHCAHQCSFDSPRSNSTRMASCSFLFSSSTPSLARRSLPPSCLLTPTRTLCKSSESPTSSMTTCAPCSQRESPHRGMSSESPPSHWFSAHLAQIQTGRSRLVLRGERLCPSPLRAAGAMPTQPERHPSPTKTNHASLTPKLASSGLRKGPRQATTCQSQP